MKNIMLCTVVILFAAFSTASLADETTASDEVVEVQQEKQEEKVATVDVATSLLIGAMSVVTFFCFLLVYKERQGQDWTTVQVVNFFTHCGNATVLVLLLFQVSLISLVGGAVTYLLIVIFQRLLTEQVSKPVAAVEAPPDTPPKKGEHS